MWSQCTATRACLLKESLSLLPEDPRANSRFVYAPDEDRMYCGSRGEWKAKNEGNLWWRALEKHPWIEEFAVNSLEIFSTEKSLETSKV